ncbi:MAG TPA: SDR family NAD(P)-dependent oxidoreductase [Methylomirabilota bacterium]|jgi:NAD(P)-dependent dehydrogenase (short-subunit alcohol dehydrogenase family)|nr:SDR family NAD(P)-dependent oxidoreductase [Methylomirabilota bacterium]
MELQGQTAIVTGAGRNIGRAIALELAGMGADVVVAEVDRATGERTAEEVRKHGRRALALQTDVTRLADLRAMADRTVAEWGRIDILVNNAGIHKSMHTADVSEADWDRLLAVNAKGVFFASQAVLRHMVKAKRGNIISLASMAGKMGLKTSLVYGITKAAVISMTRSLALAHAGDGIRANCVCPGIVETDMIFQVDREAGEGLMGLKPGEYLKQRVEQIPLGRIEKAEDVANVVGFLASSKSSYMTGQAINVTGGLVMH